MTRSVVLRATLLLALGAGMLAAAIPAARGNVSDFANALDSATETRLERAIERICLRIPVMEKAALHSSHGGFDGITPDQHAITGPAGPDGTEAVRSADGPGAAEPAGGALPTGADPARRPVQGDAAGCGAELGFRALCQHQVDDRVGQIISERAPHRALFAIGNAEPVARDDH